MRTYMVYQVNYALKTKVPIGTIMERRVQERGNNFFDLLRFARKQFASSPEEGLYIALGKTKIGAGPRKEKSTIDFDLNQ